MSRTKTALLLVVVATNQAGAQPEYQSQYRQLMTNTSGYKQYAYAPNLDPWDFKLEDKDYDYGWCIAQQKSSFEPDGVHLYQYTYAQDMNVFSYAETQNHMQISFDLARDTEFSLKGKWKLSVGSSAVSYQASINFYGSYGDIYKWYHDSVKNPYESGEFPFDIHGVLPAGSYVLVTDAKVFAQGYSSNTGIVELKDTTLLLPAPSAGALLLAACGHRRRRGAWSTEASA